MVLFFKVLWEMISQHFNEYIYLPMNEEEWIAECKKFTENYKFPCVGVWDRFHVHVATYPQNYYSFKKLGTRLQAWNLSAIIKAS